MTDTAKFFSLLHISKILVHSCVYYFVGNDKSSIICLSKQALAMDYSKKAIKDYIICLKRYLLLL